MAAKDNTNASEIDKTAFWMAGLCNICHPGGSYAEFDRNGELYYDIATAQFGYEKLVPAQTTTDVEFDGDYAEVITSGASSGDIRLAPWDKTGMAEADCLWCHRVERTINSPAPGQYMNMNWIWRAAVMRAKDTLRDSLDTRDVPAFAAAATGAQGWGTVQMAPVPSGSPPLAATFDIDYTLGFAAGGGLVLQSDDTMKVAQDSIQGSPSDWACWGCHVTADVKKRGRVWFEPSEDVHYAGLNNVTPMSSAQDLEDARTASTACTYCHPVTGDPTDRDREHNIAKGDANLGSVRNDTDYFEFKTCRQCHLAGPDKDPDAPTPTSGIHTIAPSHLGKLSCEFCHIPYKNNNASLVIDNATTGSTINYNTEKFLTSNPLVTTTPSAGTAPGRWYSNAAMKPVKNEGGVSRLFPDKLLLSCWLGDWQDQGTIGTPDAGDAVAPLPLWRVRGQTGGAPWPGLVDDNGDGIMEINTDAEILSVLIALRDNNDKHGVQLAANPVYVMGDDVYYIGAGDTLGAWSISGSALEGLVESDHPFSINHNVLPTSTAPSACADCHTADPVGSPAPFFDRKVLVSPWDGGGAPIYTTLRELLELEDPGNGLDPQ